MQVESYKVVRIVRKHSLNDQLSKNSLSSHCDYKERGKGKNRLIQLNKFVKTNM